MMSCPLLKAALAAGLLALCGSPAVAAVPLEAATPAGIGSAAPEHRAPVIFVAGYSNDVDDDATPDTDTTSGPAGAGSDVDSSSSNSDVDNSTASGGVDSSTSGGGDVDSTGTSD